MPGILVNTMKDAKMELRALFKTKQKSTPPHCHTHGFLLVTPHWALGFHYEKMFLKHQNSTLPPYSMF